MSHNMVHSSANPLQNLDKRILIAIVGFVIASVVGATSLVSAHAADKPTKEWCASQDFSNYGQCVKEWAHNKGYGYGGHEHEDIDADVHANVHAGGVMAKTSEKLDL